MRTNSVSPIAVFYGVLFGFLFGFMAGLVFGVDIVAPCRAFWPMVTEKIHADRCLWATVTNRAPLQSGGYT